VARTSSRSSQRLIAAQLAAAASNQLFGTSVAALVHPSRGQRSQVFMVQRRSAVSCLVDRVGVSSGTSSRSPQLPV
jgi:hypothetical protein